MDARQPESRPTTTMREKLARAAATALTGGWPSKPKSIDYAAVDAILNVLREHAPSLHHEDDCIVVHELRGAPDDIWKHMIDTIINEGRG